MGQGREKWTSCSFGVPDLDLHVLWLLNYVASQSVALALYPGSFFMRKPEMSLDMRVLPHDINQLFISRGSHLYVTCRSICDRDQNWIKQTIKALFGGRSRHQGDLRTPKNRWIKNVWLQLDLRTLKIKQSRASEGNNQAHFLLIKKNLILVTETSTGDI